MCNMSWRHAWPRMLRRGTLGVLRDIFVFVAYLRGKLVHDTMPIATSVVRQGKTYDSRSLFSGELSKHPAQPLLLPYGLLILLPRILLFQARTTNLMNSLASLLQSLVLGSVLSSEEEIVHRSTAASESMIRNTMCALNRLPLQGPSLSAF